MCVLCNLSEEGHSDVHDAQASASLMRLRTTEVFELVFASRRAAKAFEYRHPQLS